MNRCSPYSFSNIQYCFHTVCHQCIVNASLVLFGIFTVTDYKSATSGALPIQLPKNNIEKIDNILIISFVTIM